METEGRQPGDALIRALEESAPRFNFFQAVRFLQRATGGEPVGGERLAEAFRFRVLPSLRYPSSSVVQLRRRPESSPKRRDLELVVAFMGLAGPMGVLPPHYTRLVLDQLRRGHHALPDFLDLFNHRLISLFFRAWEKCRLPAAYEGALLRGSGEDPFTLGLYSLVGFGTGRLRRRMAFDDQALLFYAGLLADRHRPAVALQQMLSDYFEVPVALEPLRGQWLQLDPADWSALPGVSHPLGQHCQLGRDLILGERVWDVRSRFRLRLGPLTFRQFRRWIPTGDTLRPCCQIVRTYVGLGLQFDVQAILKGPEIPCLKLGASGEAQPLLGWTTWLRSPPADPATARYPDSGDAVFRLDEV